ncbi:MAG: DUF1801 domain-containing protein [Cyclobacteriaceae bacterium]
MARQLNPEVTKFLDNLAHPLRPEIEALRKGILNANSELSENIKWNGPNYAYRGVDCITMKIQPPRQIQLIFHRGVKVLAQPDHRWIDDTSGLLAWKTNDRAVATFKTTEEITARASDLADIVKQWTSAILG